MSEINTLNEQVVTLPEASVALYVTVVVPARKASPGLKLEVNDGVPQLSEAVGAVQVTIPPQEEDGVIDNVGEQPEITGNSLSVTVTVNEHVD